MPTRAQGVIWDLDGTLIDSGDLHYQSWREAMEAEAGVALTRVAFMATFGRDNQATLTALLGASPTAEQATRIIERKERYYRALATEHVRPMPGALELMAALAAQGWQQAIATSAPRENLELIVDLFGLEAWIGTQVCREDVKRGKPDPESFLLAARRMDVAVERCIVVEDAPAGIEAARAAGMAVIAVSSTQPAEALAGADRVVGSLAELRVGDFERLLNGR